MKKTRRKLRWLQFTSLLFLLAPIGAVIGINAPEYFKVQKGYVVAQYLEVSIGAILAISTGAMLLVGKTKPLKGSRGLLIALALSVLLKAIINDLVLILAALSLGSVVYSAFQPKINDMKEIFKEERKANIQAQAHFNVKEERENKIVRSGSV